MHANREGGNAIKKQKTYSTGYSLVVTDPTTNPAIIGLTMGERTGSRIFLYLWPYVLESAKVWIISGVFMTQRAEMGRMVFFPTARHMKPGLSQELR